MHLLYELQINMEGQETISHLLHRVEHLQREIKRLQNLLPAKGPMAITGRNKMILQPDESLIKSNLQDQRGLSNFMLFSALI